MEWLKVLLYTHGVAMLYKCVCAYIASFLLLGSLTFHYFDYVVYYIYITYVLSCVQVCLCVGLYME